MPPTHLLRDRQLNEIVPRLVPCRGNLFSGRTARLVGIVQVGEEPINLIRGRQFVQHAIMGSCERNLQGARRRRNPVVVHPSSLRAAVVVRL